MSLKVVAYIKQVSPGKWRVFSEKGKNMGTFNSNKKAKKRLRQIEFFKHKKAQIESTTTFSAKMRELRKNNPEKVLPFLKSFKAAFEAGCEERIEDLEETSLLQAIYEIGEAQTNE